MASIRKHGNKWQARIQRRARTLAKSFYNRADAEKWARQTEVEIDRDLYLDTRKTDETTLGELIDRYRSEITPLKKGARQERLRLDKWAQHPLAQKTLKQLRNADLARYRDERLQAGASNSTVRLELAVLSHLYTVARTEWGFEGIENPVTQIRRPAPSKGRERRLKPGELDRVIAELRHPELPSLVRLAVETAMRLGELVSLRWDRIDVGRAVLVLEDSKNGERRAVPLSTNAVSVLRSLPRRIDGRVFSLTSPRGTDLFRSAVKRARACYEAECTAEGQQPISTYLLDLRLHDLRHEAVSRLFERGLNPIEAASVSGHKTLAMLKRYAHLQAGELARKLG